MIVLMHGDREVSTKNLARHLGVKSVAPCAPAVADRHSGYQVGGTSPFGTRKAMPVYMQSHDRRAAAHLRERRPARLPRRHRAGRRGARAEAGARRHRDGTLAGLTRCSLPIPTAQRSARRSSPTSRTTVRRLAAEAATDDAAKRAVEAQATAWIEGVRERQSGSAGIEQFLTEYDLGTHEGVLLMCIAEALLRIPDAATADRLIRDKFSRGDWERHLGGESMLVNAGDLGTDADRQARALGDDDAKDPAAGYERAGRARRRAGRARGAAAGDEADGRAVRDGPHDRRCARARPQAPHPRIATRTTCWARRPTRRPTRGATPTRTRDAIDAIGAIGRRPRRAGRGSQPGISIKLSALHPRYEFAQRERVLAELLPRVAGSRASRARRGIGVTLDAEEADRLELSLDIFERAAPRRRRSPAGTASASRCRRTRSARARDRLARRAARGDAHAASWCGS